MKDNNEQLLEENGGPEMYEQEDMDRLDKHIQQYFGECENVFHEIYSPDIHVDIYIIAPTEERNYYTLVTLGMGAHRMNVPQELAEYKLERAELLITLPPDWKIDQESMQDEKWYWPIRLLKTTARLPGEEGSWLGWGHTVALNEGETYAENTRLCGVMLLNQQVAGEDADVCEISTGEDVNFYQLMPLYGEEMEYKLDNGAEALTELMGDTDLIVDVQRPSLTDDIGDDEEDFDDMDFADILMDHAEGHLESVREKNLPVDEIAAYNHLAIYMRWCMEHGLMGEVFMSKFADTVSKVRAASGGDGMPDLRVFLRDEEDLDGCLHRLYFNDEGSAFAKWYYGGGEDKDRTHFYPCDVDRYAEEYFGTEKYNSEEFQDEAYLFVPWTEQYYQDMAAIIDRQFARWQEERKAFEAEEASGNISGSDSEYPFSVTLNLNARFQPMHRHYLEDALDEIMSKQQIGEVDGGGTMQLPSGEVEYCDIEINLRDGSEETINMLLKIIGALGVPKGSKLQIYQGEGSDVREIPVGAQEGMALYLNGTQLPDEVYKECDINYVIEQMEKMMDGIGKMYSYWEGPDNTALYFYGESFDKMLSAVQGFLDEYPLCQKCEIKRIA